ncbi:MAG TPA: hypothetical protein VIO64_16700 [Pseudobacteroides sp.]|uniref:hypothetical protein n=1 Tax=Pseudobacteroides sp. TaxID=1968840 RepID=UPI002F93594B
MEVIRFILGLLLGASYFIIASFVAYNLLKKVIPGLFRVHKTISLFGKPIKLENWMVTIPSSYLVGTMLITWLAYIGAAVSNRFTDKPLLMGNIISFSIFVIFSAVIVFKRKDEFRSFIKDRLSLGLSGIGSFISRNRWELGFILISSIIVTFFMFLTLNVSGKDLTVGGTVHSDFGPHMSMIRSFSDGSNFPTQYPHFPDGKIRYHFMFQFLAGNLEYMGMRIDFAFNTPSILSLVAFLMLLYSFVVMLMGARGTGFLAAFLFGFRSSFADFTYITDKMRENIPFVDILKSLWDNASGHIGRSSSQEAWGLYAQNVYVNQRHLAFSLGIMVLILIAVYPMFRSMIGALKKVKSNTREEIKRLSETGSQSSEAEEDISNDGTESTASNNEELSYSSLYKKNWLKEFLLSKEAWIPRDIKRTVSLGLILGLMTFWNGAVTIATLPILCIMAIMSKRRLEYLGIALITVLLSFLQQNLFMGAGQAAVKPELYIGFLTTFPPDMMYEFTQYRDAHQYGALIGVIIQMMPYVIKYFIELLGIMPYIMLIAVFSIPKGIIRWISLVVVTSLIGGSILLFPDVHIIFKAAVIILMLVTTIIANSVMDYPVTPKGGKWLALAFLMPWVIAATLKLSPDVPVNHKYIMITSILFDIIMANFIYRMYIKKGVVVKAVAGLLVFVLTFTGFIDLKTLFNMNYYQNVKYSVNDPITTWVKENTEPRDVFLTTANVLDSVLLAGRPIYYGHPYYAWSAGYDTNSRESIVKRIYTCKDEAELKKLLEEGNISYILVDDGMRNEAKDLDEILLGTVFEKVRTFKQNNTNIYKVK